MRLMLPWLCLLLSACASSRAHVPDAPPAVPVQAPAVPPPSGPFGTAHPFLFQTASPDGRWVLACQAREDTNGDGSVAVMYGYHGDTFGDALEPYLFLEPGEGQRVEDFLGHDVSGRYLALVRDNAVRLLDTHTRAETELARLRPRGRPSGEDDAQVPPPLADFSPDGRRVVFLREEEGRAVAVVRELATGAERRLDAGPGELRRAGFTPSSEWAMAAVLARDSDGNGVLTWPQERTTLAGPRCRGPVISSSHMGFTGDRPTYRLLPVEGGPPAELESVLQPVGPWLLRRGPQGELFVTAPDGSQRTEWVPASCRAILAHADTERRQVLVACTAEGGPARYELHGESVHQRLAVRAQAPAGDQRFERPQRFVELGEASFDGAAPDAKSEGIVDLEQRRALPLPPGMQLLRARGARALLIERFRETDGTGAMRLHLFDATTGQSTPLGETSTYDVLEAGSLVLARGLLVDLGTGRLLGPVEGEPLALDTQGRVLRTPQQKLPGPAPRGRMPQGPVEWLPAVGPTPEP